MTAISKTWVTIADGAVDPDSPVDSTLMTGLRDDLVHLREWLGASYYAGAVQDHNHDGVNSALVEVGANMLRNGSFESGTTGWSVVNYTGGSNAVGTTGAMHGKYCLAITSTVLANGGGYALSDEYLPVSPGRMYSAIALMKASVANVSSQIEVVWYDNALAQISSSALAQTNTSTTQALYGFPASAAATAPANAAYARVKITGGVPASGSATGTIYLDGCFFIALDFMVTPVAAGTRYYTPDNNVDTAYSLGPGYAEVKNARIYQSGTYRIRATATNSTYYIRVYRNGVAYGSVRSGSFTEDLAFNAGDTVQIFVAPYSTPSVCGASTFGIGVASGSSLAYPPLNLALGER